MPGRWTKISIFEKRDLLEIDMRRLFVLLALFCCTAPALAKLELKNVQPAHGFVGPARSNDDVYALDEYFLRYQVVGLKPDADGKSDLEVSVLLVDPNGKKVVDTRGNVQRPLSLGGDTLQTFGRVSFPDKAPIGKYKLTITVKDKQTNESATIERTLDCKPVSYRILTPRFTHDAEGNVPAGASGLAGETLYFKLRVIGFDKSTKKVAMVMRVEVQTPEGKPVSKPIMVRGEITDPDKVATSSQANFNGTLILNQPGDFKLVITVEDVPGKQKTTFETPLKVTAP
jgi:hypothetical protein